MSKNLLLISNNPDDQKFAAKIATAIGFSLQTIPNPVLAAEAISKELFPVILADVDTEQKYIDLEQAIQNKVGLFSDKINANAMHFLSTQDLENVGYLVQSPLFGNFILKNYSTPEEAGTHYARIIKSSLTDKAFGLNNLLDEKAKIQTVKLVNSTQKQEAVEAVRNYLIAAKFQTRIASIVANAVDELLMNAIFDAPVDAVGKQVLAQTPRTASINLEGQHAVEMRIGYDGYYVAISATDFFGSLDKTKLLSHISKIYTEEEYRIRTTTAGAGIGLATVFRSGGSFFFVSESRTKTEVTVFFKRANSYREFKEQFRFISTQFYF